MPGRVLALLLAAVLGLLAPAASRAATPEKLFRDASQARLDGDIEAALAGFLAAAEADEQGALAPVALHGAARVLAFDLHRFDEALQALEALIALHPTHPRAAAARALTATLREGRRAGDEPLRLYYTLREHPERLPGPERATTLERLATAWPDFPFLDDVMLDLGVVQRQEGRLEEALATFAAVRARAPAGPIALEAVLEIAETHMVAGDFEAAERWFRRVPEHGGGEAAAARSVARAGAHRKRSRIHSLALAVLGTWLAFTLARIGWTRLRPAIVTNALRELVVTTPALALLAFAVRRYAPDVRDPILGIALLTLGFVTLNNLALLTRPPGRSLRVVHAGLALAGVCAIVYAVLYRYDLVFTIEETIRTGPDIF